MNMEKVYKTVYQILMGEPLTEKLSPADYAEAVRIARSLGCSDCGN